MRFDFDDRFQRQAAVDHVLIELFYDGDVGRRRRIAQVEQRLDDAVAHQRGQRQIVAKIIVGAALGFGLIGPAAR